MEALARRKLARAAARLNAASRWAGRVPPLVLMTDDDRLRDPRAAARALPKGSMVIVRSRNAATRAAHAEALMKLARLKGLIVLVAADAALAARVGADGVHLPEAAAGELAHLRVRDPGWFITLAAHSQGALAKAALAGADAVLLSPVFATKSHPDRAALTPIRANRIAAAFRVPVYALGGIDARNAALLSPAFAGLAAIGALEA